MNWLFKQPYEEGKVKEDQSDDYCRSPEERSCSLDYDDNDGKG